jgi:uncharacterized protein with PQ loop repeat
MSIVEVIGWVASFMFAFCGAPAAYQALKTKQDHTNPYLIWMWFIGEVLMQVYVIAKHGFDMPLLFQYWINTLFVVIIIIYKYGLNKFIYNKYLMLLNKNQE